MGHGYSSLYRRDLLKFDLCLGLRITGRNEMIYSWEVGTICRSRETINNRMQLHPPLATLAFTAVVRSSREVRRSISRGQSKSMSMALPARLLALLRDCINS